MERCIKCGEITVADTRDDQPTTWTTCPKCEYKPERANVPSKYVLGQLKLAYMWLKADDIFRTKICLITARDRAIDQRVVDDIKSVYDLIDTPEKAMARIAEILTCGGRIYDEYSSEFLKGGKG